MQSHNVVYFDHDTNKFVLDPETTNIRFEDGSVYSEETGAWFTPKQGSIEEQKEFEAYNLLQTLLDNFWNTLNRIDEVPETREDWDEDEEMVDESLDILAQECTCGSNDDHHTIECYLGF